MKKNHPPVPPNSMCFELYNAEMGYRFNWDANSFTWMNAMDLNHISLMTRFIIASVAMREWGNEAQRRVNEKECSKVPGCG